jgi:hypothetical protein
MLDSMNESPEEVIWAAARRIGEALGDAEIVDDAEELIRDLAVRLTQLTDALGIPVWEASAAEAAIADLFESMVGSPEPAVNRYLSLRLLRVNSLIESCRESPVS